MTFAIKTPAKIGLAARLEAAKKTGLELETVKPASKAIAFVPVNDPQVKDKLGVIFDDSGSMRGGDKIGKAKTGLTEFLRSCTPNQVAVSVYPLNRAIIKLSTDLIQLAQEVQSIEASGSTPLIRIILKALETPVTRLIAFSDGRPDSTFTGPVVSICKEKKIPIDTFYIGPDDSSAIDFMRSLAEDTGGIFVHLKDASDIRKSLKYLAPAFRAMLMDKSFKEKVERGEV